jgi:hypothetical protein
MPFPPLRGMQLVVGNVPIRDRFGNTSACTYVCTKNGNLGRLIIRGAAHHWPHESNVSKAFDFRDSSGLEKLSVNNKLVISAPTSLDQMLQSKIDTGDPLVSKALLCPSENGKLELVMDLEDDYMSITYNSAQTPIGIGSPMRFCADKWVDFLGAKYRKGGFKVTQAGIQFDDATEKNDGGKVFKHQGSQWIPFETN